MKRMFPYALIFGLILLAGVIFLGQTFLFKATEKKIEIVDLKSLTEKLFTTNTKEDLEAALGIPLEISPSSNNFVTMYEGKGNSVLSDGTRVTRVDGRFNYSSKASFIVIDVDKSPCRSLADIRSAFGPETSLQPSSFHGPQEIYVTYKHSRGNLNIGFNDMQGTCMNMLSIDKK